MAVGTLNFNLVAAFKIQGASCGFSSACASSAHAIGYAFDDLTLGRQKRMFIVGGEDGNVDAILPFAGMRTLSLQSDPNLASRPFDRDRDGFVMGEGAGILLLEELEHAKSRGAKIYAEIVGYGMTADAYHMTSPNPNGEAAARAIRFALKDAAINPNQVSYINAHGTSTAVNDSTETIAIKKALGEYANKTPISSTKSMTGHLLGAAGGVEAVICGLTIQNGVIAPTINLEHPDPECDLDYVPNAARKADVRVTMSNSFGFGGHDATIILKKFEA